MEGFRDELAQAANVLKDLVAAQNLGKALPKVLDLQLRNGLIVPPTSVKIKRNMGLCNATCHRISYQIRK